MGENTLHEMTRLKNRHRVLSMSRKTAFSGKFEFLVELLTIIRISCRTECVICPPNLFQLRNQRTQPVLPLFYALLYALFYALLYAFFFVLADHPCQPLGHRFRLLSPFALFRIQRSFKPMILIHDIQ